MSCVVGLLNNGNLYMGADGIATTEDGEKRPIICHKIFTNKQYLLGYTGSVRHGQLVGPRFFDPPENVYDLADKMREKFAEKGAVLTIDTGQQMHSSNFLIGYQGRLFEILIDFQFNEVLGDYTAIGSGASYAMGSLYATKRWTSPTKRILNALEAASEYDRSCGKPFMIEVQK